MIASWPALVSDPGAIRSNYLDVVDVGPTLLEAAGCQFASTVNGVAQLPVAGRSFLATFTNPRARTRTRQFFELRGHRAITDGPWRAVTIHDCNDNYTNDIWQLFKIDEDFAESTDVAAKYPMVMAHMQQLWDQEWKRWVGRPLGQPAPNICALNSDYSRPTMTRPDR